MSEYSILNYELAKKWLSLSAQAGNQDAIDNIKDLEQKISSKIAADSTRSSLFSRLSKYLRF